ncbi:hypothetical protein IEQ34_006696 [Dendrobium chrysotoxum]|uniref:Uncharacterized protein n=1 Tax=Dendrobium chrysotoxum TaxID=161865 RepID=A0AAV7H8X5_DENCH|nr:hypothetical protein IEQ34_006696 [Dendrobium chrysotoxum]
MSSSSLRRCRLGLQSGRTGRSTAQANLAKILTIIVTVPPTPTPTYSVIGTTTCPDANDIPTTTPEVALNLDLTLGPSLDMPRGSELHGTPAEEEEEIPTAHSGVVNCPNQTLCYETPTVNKVSKKVHPAADSFLEADTSSEGECSPEATPIMLGSVKEISEITNTSCKAEEYINGEAEGREGYLDLLLEAARQVSREVEDIDNEKASPDAPRPPPAASASVTRKRTASSPASSRSKRRAAAAASFIAYEETEPIVRSRRGRNQALPSRYRDSILEPWRKTPTVLRR